MKIARFDKKKRRRRPLASMGPAPHSIPLPGNFTAADYDLPLRRSEAADAKTPEGYTASGVCLT